MSLKQFFLIAILLSCSFSFGQITEDSVIIRKYINDTVGFNRFPNIQLMDSVVPEKVFVKWQLKEVKIMQIIHGHSYFTTCWCPDLIFWYILAQKENADTLAIGNTDTLQTFIKNMDNKYNACLWLFTQKSQGIASKDIPLDPIGVLQYKKVSDGFLISFNSRIKNAPVTNGSLVYFVGKDRKVVLIKQKITEIKKGVAI